jgi:hypothetical protein
MPDNQNIRQWLNENNYGDIVNLIEQVMDAWKKKRTKTRRNWWDVLAGHKNGTPRTIEGVTFPVLKAAQIRKDFEVTNSAICRNEKEIFPGILNSGRWAKRVTQDEGVEE